MNNRLVIFGAAPSASRIMEQLLPYDRVIAICDNSPSKVGSTIRNIKVEKPEILNKFDWDLIVICSSSMAIYLQLREMGIPADKIIYARREIMRGDYSRSSFYLWVVLFTLFIIILSGIGKYIL